METHDTLLQTVLLAILAIIGLLVLDALFSYVNRSRDASRLCPDCINQAAVRRLRRPEEAGPHKVTLEKDERR